MVTDTRAVFQMYPVVMQPSLTFTNSFFSATEEGKQRPYSEAAGSSSSQETPRIL
jgi:hypothetical protein